MPQNNLVEVFAEKNAVEPPHPIEPVRDSEMPAESRLQTTRLEPSVRTNILFAVMIVAGVLFCAFYFFNGPTLVRALAGPGEQNESPAAETTHHLEVAAGNAAAEAGGLTAPLEGASSKPDRSGDPFSRAQKLISLDRPLASFGRGGGLSAGNPPPFLPPPFFGSPSRPGVPGLPGGSVGGLPGPGTLISRLILLLPGGDALTHVLRTAE